MTEETKDAILDVKTDLQERAKPQAGDIAVSENMLSEAENVIASMANEYIIWVKDDIARLDGFFEQFLQKHDDASLHEMFEISHDMKGQGGSFGYNLITTITGSLCKVIEALRKKKPPYEEKEISAVKVHIDAIKMIAAEHIKGDGGDVGRKLVDGIDAVKKKLNM